MEPPDNDQDASKGTRKKSSTTLTRNDQGCDEEEGLKPPSSPAPDPKYPSSYDKRELSDGPAGLEDEDNCEPVARSRMSI
eukprot:14524973-Ditylum_brightwellii.AAC.1